MKDSINKKEGLVIHGLINTMENTIPESHSRACISNIIICFRIIMSFQIGLTKKYLLSLRSLSMRHKFPHSSEERTDILIIIRSMRIIAIASRCPISSALA